VANKNKQQGQGKPTTVKEVIDRIKKLYREIKDREFEDLPDDENKHLKEHLEKQKNPIDFANYPLKTIRTKPQEESIKLKLEKRALSYAHGVCLALETIGEANQQKKLNKTQNQIIKKFDALKNLINKTKGLEDPKVLKKFFKTEFYAYKKDLLDTFKLWQKTEAKLKNTQGHPRKTIEHFEYIANWERKKFPVVTPITSSDGKKDYLISVPDGALKDPEDLLTEEQKEEYKELDGKKWFKNLPIAVQQWFKNNKEKLQTNHYGSPSSVFHSLPQCSNVWWDHVVRFNSDKQVESAYITQRQSVATPVDLFKKSSSEVTRLTQLNTAQQVAMQDRAQLKEAPNNKNSSGPSSSTTLIPKEVNKQQKYRLSVSYLSPLPMVDIRNYNNNNSKMLKETTKALQAQENMLVSNWPINSARIFSDPFKDRNNIKTRFQLTSLIIDKWLGQKQISTERLSVPEYTLGKMKQRLEHLLKKLEKSPNGIKATDDLNIKIKDNIAILRGHLKRYKSDPHLKEHIDEKLRSAFEAMLDYEEAWHLPRDQRNGEDFNLKQASREKTMAAGLGISISHNCKSSKDRCSVASIDWLISIINPQKQNKSEIQSKLAEHYEHTNEQHIYGAAGIQKSEGLLGKYKLLKKLFSKLVGHEITPMSAGAQEQSAILASETKFSKNNPGLGTLIKNKVKKLLGIQDRYSKQSNIALGQEDSLDQFGDELKLCLEKVKQNSQNITNNKGSIDTNNYAKTETNLSKNKHTDDEKNGLNLEQGQNQHPGSKNNSGAKAPSTFTRIPKTLGDEQTPRNRSPLTYINRYSIVNSFGDQGSMVNLPDEYISENLYQTGISINT
jgi:hypothetical protein